MGQGLFGRDRGPTSTLLCPIFSDLILAVIFGNGRMDENKGGKKKVYCSQKPLRKRKFSCGYFTLFVLQWSKYWDYKERKVFLDTGISGMVESLHLHSLADVR